METVSTYLQKECSVLSSLLYFTFLKITVHGVSLVHNTARTKNLNRTHIA